jgi:LytS/YehU family sensor histidine kinase
VHVLMITVIVAVVYASLMRSARARAAFDAAELQRVATRRRLTEARLSALQAKVDPRFLFGTLELVEVLYERDPASAERTLAAMIDFLRTALPSGADEGSTVAREVRLVRDYLEIAGVRMGSRLQFDIRVDADVDAARCPAMILVPIVEDALTGGLEPMPHGGRLTLEAQRRGDRLVVSVAQSGVARRPPVAWLQSLRDRLAEIHGDDARLEVTGVANGTTTTLDVPYESTQGIVTSSVAASTTGEPA